MKRIAFVLVAVCLTLGAVAKDDPKGKDEKAKALPVLVGQVVDQDTGEALTGVSIKVNGSETCVFTDFDGSFEIRNLDPGKYNLEISLISYQSNLLENLEVNGGERKALKVEMKR